MQYNVHYIGILYLIESQVWSGVMGFCVYLTYNSEQDSVLEGRPFNKKHREPDCDDIDINIRMKKIMLMVMIVISILWWKNNADGADIGHKMFYHLLR